MIKKLKNYINNNTKILIRFDDIAENMNWALMEKCEELFNKFSIKPLLGVIPKNQDKELLKYPHNKDFWNTIRRWKDIGWEIAMHGYTHVYDSAANKKKDYFKYGGGSEFYGHSIEEQKNRLQKGLKKFEEEDVNVRAFFAPNHIYDKNTFTALRSLGISQVIDGYGLFPYKENEITFIPQLFYENIFMPFGFQTTQIHLNYWNSDDFLKFENLITKNYHKITTYDEMLNNINNGLLSSISRTVSSNLLMLKRSVNSK